MEVKVSMNNAFTTIYLLLQSKMQLNYIILVPYINLSLREMMGINKI
jgi:hypothetical protein